MKRIQQKIKDRIIEAIERTVDRQSAHATVLCSDIDGNIDMGSLTPLHIIPGEKKFICPPGSRPIVSINISPESGEE